MWRCWCGGSGIHGPVCVRYRGRHARPYDELVAMLDRRELRRQERLGVTYAGRHRRDDDG